MRHPDLCDDEQTSKTLNYLDSPWTQPYFAAFIGIWIYLRHYLNFRLLYAVLTEFKTVGPYELNWETQQYKCWISQIITFGLLAMLQAVNIFWLVLILRIMYRFLVTKDIKDERSDDEEEAEETETREVLLQERDRFEASQNGKLTEGPTVLLNGSPMLDEKTYPDVRRRV